MTKVWVVCWCLLAGFASTAYAQANFHRADSVAALYPKHSLHDLKPLALKLTQPLSHDTEKFRAIYKWVCNNIETDYGLYMQTVRKRALLKKPQAYKTWNQKFTAVLIRQLLTRQKTVCSGYAYLLKELAFHAGIHCVIVNGYGRTAQSNVGGAGILNHTWNAVQLDGRWHLCDATWSSGTFDAQHGVFVKKFNGAYFLADPALFIHNHYPSDSSWTLLNKAPSLHEFLNGPLTYAAAYDYDIQGLHPSRFNIDGAKGDTLPFTFTTRASSLIKKVTLQIKGPHSTEIISPQFSIDESGGCYTVQHTFTARGYYLVHLVLNDDPVATYAVVIENSR